MRRGLVIVLTAAVGVSGGILAGKLHGGSAAVVHTALPAFHGQATWHAGVRPAPGFTLTDQGGAAVSLRAFRGRPVLLTFLDSQCRQSCPIVGRQLGSILRRLPAAQRPALLIVSVDHAGDTPKAIRHALATWGLAGPWETHWLNAPTRAELAGVWRRYGVAVQPATNDIVHSLALYLVDRSGDERTAYLFPFLPAFVQRDLATLASHA